MGNLQIVQQIELIRVCNKPEMAPNYLPWTRKLPVIGQVLAVLSFAVKTTKPVMYITHVDGPHNGTQSDGCVASRCLLSNDRLGQFTCGPHTVIIRRYQNSTKKSASSNLRPPLMRNVAEMHSKFSGTRYTNKQTNKQYRAMPGTDARVLSLLRELLFPF